MSTGLHGGQVSTVSTTGREGCGLAADLLSPPGGRAGLSHLISSTAAGPGSPPPLGANRLIDGRSGTRPPSSDASSRSGRDNHRASAGGSKPIMPTECLS